MVRKTHLQKNSLLKPPAQAYIHDATTNMQKYIILPNFQKEPKYFRKTHEMSFKFFEDNVQDPGRL